MRLRAIKTNGNLFIYRYKLFPKLLQNTWNPSAELRLTFTKQSAKPLTSPSALGPSIGYQSLSAGYTENWGMSQIVKSACANSIFILIEVRSDSQSDNCCFLCSDLIGRAGLCCAVTVKTRQDKYQPFNFKLFVEIFHGINLFHAGVSDFFFFLIK